MLGAHKILSVKVFLRIKYCETYVSDRDLITITNNDIFIVSKVGVDG